MDISDYTDSPRVRRALRSLATYGTSHGVAQASMWRICNDVPFEYMAAQQSKVLNVHEVALAARFVAAVDASSDRELVDPAYLTQSRLFVHLEADGPLDRDARRIAGAMDGLRLLGLPVQVVDDPSALPAAGTSAPALLVKVKLTATSAGLTRGRVFIDRAVVDGDWVNFGKTSFEEGSAASVLDATTLLKTLDHAIASAFVTVKPVKHGNSSTTLKIENRLPLTLANIVVKAGGSAGQPRVAVRALGVGPARSGLMTIEAPGGSIDHVELNGL